MSKIRSCYYNIPYGLTYWDLIGRWFSGESKLDILVDGDKIVRNSNTDGP